MIKDKSFQFGVLVPTGSAELELNVCNSSRGQRSFRSEVIWVRGHPGQRSSRSFAALKCFCSSEMKRWRGNQRKFCSGDLSPLWVSEKPDDLLVNLCRRRFPQGQNVFPQIKSSFTDMEVLMVLDGPVQSTNIRTFVLVQHLKFETKTPTERK